MITQKHITIIYYVYTGFLGLIFVSLGFAFEQDLIPVQISSLPVWLLVSGFLTILSAAILPAFLLHRYGRKIRTRNLKLFAHSLGWQYEKQIHAPYLKMMAADLKIWWKNALHSDYESGMTGGVRDWDFFVFDGEYEENGGDRDTIGQTVFVLDLKNARLPLFGLEPEIPAVKLKAAFNKKLNDLFFEKYQSFSYKYMLYGKNEDAIRALFNDGVLSFFENQKPFSVFAEGNLLVMSQPGKICPPDKLGEQLDLLVRVADLFLRNEPIKKETLRTVPTDETFAKKKTVRKKPSPKRIKKGSVQYW